jgi:uncharacterized membrane protein YheB (UPF0754 family)
VPKPIIDLVIGEKAYAQIKNDVSAQLVAVLPAALAHIESYATHALDIETLLREKMGALPSKDFEALLHPVFEQDEWKLILIGGVLGLIVGLIQTFTLDSSLSGK